MDIDKIRVKLATALAPIVGFIVFFSAWYYIGASCDIGNECLGWGPLTLIFVPAYAGISVIFMFTVISRAEKSIVNNCLSFFKFVKAPLIILLSIVLLIFIYSLGYKQPDSVADWAQNIIFIFLPLIAFLPCYISWYFIAGRYNKSLNRMPQSGTS